MIKNCNWFSASNCWRIPALRSSLISVLSSRRKIFFFSVRFRRGSPSPSQFFSLSSFWISNGFLCSSYAQQTPNFHACFIIGLFEYRRKNKSVSFFQMDPEGNDEHVLMNTALDYTKVIELSSSCLRIRVLPVLCLACGHQSTTSNWTYQSVSVEYRSFFQQFQRADWDQISKAWNKSTTYWSRLRHSRYESEVLSVYDWLGLGVCSLVPLRVINHLISQMSWALSPRRRRQIKQPRRTLPLQHLFHLHHRLHLRRCRPEEECHHPLHHRYPLEHHHLRHPLFR